MKNCVSFYNAGLIDPRAFRLFGASAKANSNPIGYFGTGLKYAIAVTLRLGGRVELWRGTECTRFTSRAATMRDQEFQVVFANDDELGYTTELGKNWQAWQAFRELWCNAMDEGGTVELGEVEPADDRTLVRVYLSDMVDQYHKREEIVLFGKPRWLCDGIEVYERPTKHLYYRNIRIAELQQESDRTYNIVGHTMELTEDRTLRYPFMAGVYISRALLFSTDKDYIKDFLTARPESYEAKLDLSSEGAGQTFLRVLEEDLRWGQVTNMSAMTVFRKSTGKSRQPKEKVVTGRESEMIAEALKVLNVLGANLTAEDIHVTEELDDNTLGLCYAGQIWIAKRTFVRGQRQVTGTIYEELLHWRNGLHDESRAMQNFLLDKLIELAEERLEE